MTASKSLTILIVDDDEDDLFFARRALEKSAVPGNVYTVHDGVEMMEYLYHENGYDAGNAPLPDIILLDLNMPKKNGKEALAELRADDDLRYIPVILFTTSGADQDILTCYQLGANSYIRKPVSFDAMVETMDVLKKYWVEHASLPSRRPE